MSIIKVKSGAVDRGFDYESKLITALAAKLVKDGTIKDFWIVQSPEEIDKFGDIVLSVCYKDKRKRKIFLIQAKPKENKELCKRLSYYQDSYKKIKRIRQYSNTVLTEKLNSVDFDDYYFCVFTNATIGLNFKEETTDKTVTLIDIRGNGCKKLQHAGGVEADFRKKLHMFSEQPDHESIILKIVENVDGFTRPMAYHLCNRIADHLVHPVDDGYDARPLTRDVFAAKCMEVVLCQQISTHMTATREIDRKHFEIWNTVFSKRLVVIGTRQLENLLPLIASYYETKINEFLKSKRKDVQEFKWNSCFHNMFRVDNSVRNVLGKDGKSATNLVDLLLYIWNRSSFPLLVNSTFVRNFGWFVGNDKRHFIVIVDGVSENIRAVADVAETVFDFRKNEDIMDLTVSLQGRERASLRQISDGDEDVLRSIPISEALLWTAKECGGRQLGGTLRSADDDYIPRIFHPNGQTEEDVLKAPNNIFTVISNDAGMGKSTVLRSLARKYDNKSYVIYCDLNDFGGTADPHSDPVQYFYEKMETKRTEITDAICRYHKKSGRIVLFLDSHDETLPKHEGNILRILHEILAQNITLYTTMRVQAETDLKSMFKTECSIRLLSLAEFADKDIADYCKKVAVLERDDIPYDFLRVPLNLKIYADHYKQTKHMKLNKTRLYQHLLSRKIEEFYKTRKIEGCNDQALLNVLKKSAMEHHHRIALVLLFGLDTLEELRIFKEDDWTKTVRAYEERELSLGIVTNIDPVKFVHQSFAEYLTAKYLAAHPNRKLYLKIITDEKLSVVSEFLFTMRSDMAGELPRVILEGDPREVERILATNVDTAVKGEESMYPVQWAAISCRMNKNNSKKGTTLEILNYIIERIEHGEFVNYSIESRDKFLNWTWLNYFAGCEDDTDLYYAELSSYAKDEETPKLIRRKIVERIGSIFEGKVDFAKQAVPTTNLISKADYGDQNAFRQNTIITSADDGKGNVFLHACAIGNLRIVKQLPRHLEESEDKDGQNGLHYACKMGRAGVANYLLLELGFDVNKKTKNNKIALHYACASDDVDLINLLLNFGADLKARDKRGMTPFHYACSGGKRDFVIKLLETKSDIINEIDDEGMNALHHACRATDVETVEILLRAGLQPTERDKKGLGVIHHACTGGDLEIVRCLLRGTSKRDSLADNRGRSGLHIACAGGHQGLVELLIENNFDVRRPDENGETPLHYAAKFGYTNVTRTLLLNGADPNSANNQKVTPLQMACANGHEQTAQLLLDAGCDPTRRDANGSHALDHALNGGNLRIIEMLMNRENFMSSPNEKRASYQPM